jgi:hypothetical protein
MVAGDPIADTAEVELLREGGFGAALHAVAPTSLAPAVR